MQCIQKKVGVCELHSKITILKFVPLNSNEEVRRKFNLNTKFIEPTSKSRKLTQLILRIMGYIKNYLISIFVNTSNCFLKLSVRRLEWKNLARSGNRTRSIFFHCDVLIQFLSLHGSFFTFRQMPGSILLGPTQFMFTLFSLPHAPVHFYLFFCYYREDLNFYQLQSRLFLKNK